MFITVAIIASATFLLPLISLINQEYIDAYLVPLTHRLNGFVPDMFKVQNLTNGVVEKAPVAKGPVENSLQVIRDTKSLANFGFDSDIEILEDYKDAIAGNLALWKQFIHDELTVAKYYWKDKFQMSKMVAHEFLLEHYYSMSEKNQAYILNGAVLLVLAVFLLSFAPVFKFVYYAVVQDAREYQERAKEQYKHVDVVQKPVKVESAGAVEDMDSGNNSLLNSFNDKISNIATVNDDILSSFKEDSKILADKYKINDALSSQELESRLNFLSNSTTTGEAENGKARTHQAHDKEKSEKTTETAQAMMDGVSDVSSGNSDHDEKSSVSSHETEHHLDLRKSTETIVIERPVTPVLAGSIAGSGSRSSRSSGSSLQGVSPSKLIFQTGINTAQSVISNENAYSIIIPQSPRVGKKKRSTRSLRNASIE